MAVKYHLVRLIWWHPADGRERFRELATVPIRPAEGPGEVTGVARWYAARRWPRRRHLEITATVIGARADPNDVSPIDPTNPPGP